MIIDDAAAALRAIPAPPDAIREALRPFARAAKQIPHDLPDELWTSCSTYEYDMKEEVFERLKADGVSLLSRKAKLLLWIDGHPLSDFRRAAQVYEALSTLPQPMTDNEIQSSDVSGSPVADNPDDPTASRLQQGLATPNTTSTDKISSRRNRDVGNVAKPERQPASAPPVSPGTSEAFSPALDPATVEACIEAISEVVQKRDDLGYIHFAELAHAIRALLAQPHACNASEAWQPIETAPKDGSRCDVWAVYDNGMESRGCRYVDAQYREHENSWFDAYGNRLDWEEIDEDDGIKRGRKTTHWMPLPASPSNPQEALPPAPQDSTAEGE
jgi:hypothetical protein